MTGAPNFDAMSAAELWEFWSSCNRHPNRRAAALFPERPVGYVRALKDLRNYAANTAAARSCRERGDIDSALLYERIADGIYNKLPAFARW